MLLAAARSVADRERSSDNGVGEAGILPPLEDIPGILPPLEDIHSVSRRIAFAVGKAAMADGVCETIEDQALTDAIDQQWWAPNYRPISAI